MKTLRWVGLTAAAIAASLGCSADVEDRPGDNEPPAQNPPAKEESKPDRADVGDLDLELERWIPCARKACGDACTVCDPNNASCSEPPGAKTCTASGECVNGNVSCRSTIDEASGGSGPQYAPCRGKACGERCTLCAPGDTSCVETAVEKACDARGQCVAGAVECREAPSPEENATAPCADKECGAICGACEANDPRCLASMDLKTCTANGECVEGLAKCVDPQADLCERLRQMALDVNESWAELGIDAQAIVQKHCQPVQAPVQQPMPSIPRRQ